MKEELQKMISNILSEFQDELVHKTSDRDLADPETAYVKLQSLVNLHGVQTPNGKTMRLRNPVGDIVAVTLDKNGGMFDLIAVDSSGGKRRLDASSLLDPEKTAELHAMCNELSIQVEDFA